MNVTGALAQRLREHANPDGGWGYTPGSRSRDRADQLGAARAGGGLDDRRRLVAGARISASSAAHRHPEACSPIDADAPPNYAFSALAALAVNGTYGQPRRAVVPRLTEAIIGGRGVALPADEDDAPAEQSPGLAVDRRLLQLGRADGVVPAAAETAAGRVPDGRMRSPHRGGRSAAVRSLLRRRRLELRQRGGAGQSLDPFVPTTAMALLALQDRRGAPDRHERASRYLQAHAQSESSGMALALSLICFARFGLPTEALEEALVAQYARSRFLDQQHVMAMALYALAAGRTGMGAFRV